MLYTQPVENKSEVKLKILDNEYWWGGSVVDGSLMPYGTAGFSHNQYGDIKGNQAQPLFISNQGRYIWSEYPLNIEFTTDSIKVHTNSGKIDHGQSGKTLKDAFLFVSQKFFPSTGQIPDPLLFSSPQYNTWIELQYDQNEKDILAYARAILDNGFPPGVLMIDDNWQIDYGNWDFSLERFQNPKKMMDKLHKMGFKVMVWICPFISSDSEVYRKLKSKRLLVFEDAEKTLPAIVRWWNGASALIDLFNPEGEKWYIDLLLNLQKKYGVDGFKLDAGDPNFYTDVYSYKDVIPNDHTEKHTAIGLNFPLNEYRASWKMAGQPIAQRLRDKEHTWKHLRALIPDILAQGLIGYAFTCPDMIGGGEVDSFTDSLVLDEELVVRSAQCHALMPMMQFSVAPWRILNKKNLEICRKMARLHHEFGEEILKIARESAKTGEPIVRHMEYMFPHKGYEKIIDQFMLGDHILVAPVVEKGKTSRFVEFPEGIWKGDDGKIIRGPVRLPVDAPIERLPWFRKIDDMKTGYKTEQMEEMHNRLTQTEKNRGWELLFDGKSFNGWRGLGREKVQTDHWKVEDGMIRKVNNQEVSLQNNGELVEGGDLMTIETFDNFELYFEWKIKHAGNSGIKFNVSEEMSMQYESKYSALGFEYQILDDDDEQYRGKLKPSQYTASLYDMMPPQNIRLNPVGRFNYSRIVLNGNHGEHWLNGIKVLEYEFETAQFDSLFQLSKYVKYPDFKKRRKGHIVITDHDDDSWYRNIKIRKL
jgi:alpha-glucosidase